MPPRRKHDLDPLALAAGDTHGPRQADLETGCARDNLRRAEVGAFDEESAIRVRGNGAQGDLVRARGSRQVLRQLHQRPRNGLAVGTEHDSPHGAQRRVGPHRFQGRARRGVAGQEFVGAPLAAAQGER